jgi:hypothetical protein
MQQIADESWAASYGVGHTLKAIDDLTHKPSLDFVLTQLLSGGGL